MNVYQRPNTTTTLACIASGSVRIQSKEQETKVQDRIKNDANKRAETGWERKVRKHCLAEKPQDFENHPFGVLCLSTCTAI